MTELLTQLRSALGSGFEVERELSRGGMSRVFLATETRLNRRVVIKVLRPEIAAGTSTERFAREIEVCARCQHPHIVPLLSAGHAGELPYFTMPYVEGESLRDRLTREGPFPVGEVVRLLIEITDGLSYAHRHGVVHRDIKPENILIQDGHAVIADFGVAKALDVATGAEASVLATSAGVVLGTPAYMAPEQATGDPGVDHRADLYAIGVLGYELLTGQPPFGELVPPALVSAQLTRTAPPVNRLRKDCPPALAKLIGRLLAREAAQRPASAEVVRDELIAIRSGGGGLPTRSRNRLVGAGIGLLLVAGVLALLLTRPEPATPDLEGTKSLAVLPFQNIGGDSAADYFGQGLAEELISALGRLRGLRVASRTSAFSAQLAGLDLRAIGERLGVMAVLEGSWQQVGSRVRVSARLVDARQENQLWSGDYRAELRDVFEVQDTIAQSIARALEVTLAGSVPGSAPVLVERGTRDEEAHDRYLRGRYFLGQRTLDGSHRAVEAFQAAIARDSNYAAAWAGLAEASALIVPFGDLPPQQAAARAKPAALRALQLDSTLAEVHTSLGFIAMWLEWDLAEAERQFELALQLNPSDGNSHLYRTWMLAATGRLEEALNSIETARRLDPLSLIVNTRRGTALQFLGRDQEAIGAFQRALELDSTFAFARAGLAVSLAMTGRCPEALALPVRLEALLGGDAVGEPGVVLARCGRTAEARRLLADLEALRRTRYVSADGIAAIYGALGQMDRAFEELERAVRERAFTLVWARVRPMHAPLRSDPRWAELMRRAGLEP